MYRNGAIFSFDLDVIQVGLKWGIGHFDKNVDFASVSSKVRGSAENVGISGTKRAFETDPRSWDVGARLQSHGGYSGAIASTSMVSSVSLNLRSFCEYGFYSL